MNFLEERIVKRWNRKRGKCFKGGQFPESSDGYRII